MKDTSTYFSKNKIINLKEFLLKENLINSLENSIEIDSFSNGYSNLTYLISTDSRKLVLRRPPEGAIKRGHDMGREYNVLSNLISEFKQIPEVYCFCDNPETIGAPFYIMEKVDGIILTENEAKQRIISPKEYEKISTIWLDTFIKLHAVDYKRAGLQSLGKPDNYIERQVTNWGKQYIKAATEDIPEALKIINWMNENQPKKHDSCLIHNDYKYDNVIFNDSTWSEINAVLDWEMCTIGDPLMDLGTSLAYWTTNEDGPIIIKNFPSPTNQKGNPSRQEIVDQYALKSGRSINNLVFYYAFGLFKIAVIVQQIYYRYDKGMTQNKKFSKLNEAARFFCIMAWQAIQNKRIDRLF